MKPAGNQLYDNHLWLPPAFVDDEVEPIWTMRFTNDFYHYSGDFLSVFFDRPGWITEYKVIV